MDVATSFREGGGWASVSFVSRQKKSKRKSRVLIKMSMSRFECVMDVNIEEVDKYDTYGKVPVQIKN